MSDPLRSDGLRAIDTTADAVRDAKIEQLLLVGLDQYFAAQYEQAVNVWTRALFLDRSHPTARAYIERARSALAERQRGFEELLETGVAAFHRGDAGEARRLIQAAIDGGAPADEAFAVLDRLDRLQRTPVAPPIARPRDDRPRDPTLHLVPAAPTAAFGIAAALALVFAALTVAALTASTWNRPAWRSLAGFGHAATASPVAPAPGEKADRSVP